MKRRSFVIIAAIVASSLAPIAGTAQQQTVPAASAPAQSQSPSPASTPTTLEVPAGTGVPVSFVDTISSDSATEGSTVAIQVTKEIDINGMMVVAKDAQGQATLTKVQHSGGNGSGGKIEFNVDWVYSVDGGKIALSPVNNTTPDADRKGAASTLGILGWATFGLLGLFSHNMAHGNAAVIKPDKVFNVFVDHTVHVTTNRVATTVPGFDN